MRGMRSECGESEWKCKKCENQGGNPDIATEMAQNSNGNGKFNEWREVKIIENEHIC